MIPKVLRYLGSFCVGQNPITLVLHQKKVIPQKIQKYVVYWYNAYLLHPGLDRTEAMIFQHLYWPRIRNTV